jgi:lipopolysaccharide/colanic/teichoic acid biosynthesis glycosyltransferase
LKRTIDIFVAIVVGILSLPLVAIAAFAIKTADPGPMFFTQQRRGLYGKPFRLVKLRTMRQNADLLVPENGKAANVALDPRIYRSAVDPRIIPKIGAFLRRYSIDELPQIWNVLVGELTLVGPRALPEYHARLLGDEFLALRESVKPGITGLWQIKSRNQGDPTTIERYDREYIANSGVWFDVWILLRTVVCVIRGMGI